MSWPSFIPLNWLAAIFFGLAAAIAAQPEKPEPQPKTAALKPTLVLKVAVDGSVTLADGRHIDRDQLRDGLLPLVSAGPRPEVVLHLDAATKELENLDKLGFALQMAGIREIVIYHPAEKDPHRLSIGEPRPADRILNARDDAERDAAVKDLLADLNDDKRRYNALYDLRKVAEVPFDRAPFLPLVRAALNDRSAGNYCAAMTALPTVGGNVEDVPAVLRYLADEDLGTRCMISSTLYSIDPLATHPGVFDAVEKLLDDSDERVRLYTMKSLWGHPSSPGIDRRLIKMSFHPRNGYDTIYYALSTRPLVRRPVAERLIELVTGPANPNSSRALWGITHHAPEADCLELVTPVLISVAKSGTDLEDRRYAIYGLGSHQHPSAVKVLSELIEGDEPEEIKKAARQAIEALKRPREKPKQPDAA